MENNFKKGKRVPGISLPLSQSEKSTRFLIFFQEDKTYEVINLNSTMWPKDFTVEKKLSLCRGDIVDLCWDGRKLSGLVVKKSDDLTSLEAKMRQLEQKISSRQSEKGASDSLMQSVLNMSLTSAVGSGVPAASPTIVNEQEASFCSPYMKRRRIDSESDSDASNEEPIACTVSGKFLVSCNSHSLVFLNSFFFLVSDSSNSTKALKHKATDVQSETLEVLKRICSSLDKTRKEQRRQRLAFEKFSSTLRQLNTPFTPQTGLAT